MSCDKSQYCAYAHVSAMLARTGLPWWLAMFEIELYFDDSGTDGGTPVAVAACYVFHNWIGDHDHESNGTNLLIDAGASNA